MNQAAIDSVLARQYEEFSAARNKYMRPLIDKGVPFITALVMAGDLYSADKATERVLAGEDPVHLHKYVGSYARFEWCLKHLPKEHIFPILPELWRGSDPDDTKAEYLALWKEAKVANGGRIVIDDEEFPSGATDVALWRGQVGNTLGISWTTDIEIARKFAATGGGRTWIKGGQVISALADVDDVLAYITGRGESEIIVDPSRVIVCGRGAA